MMRQAWATAVGVVAVVMGAVIAQAADVPVLDGRGSVWRTFIVRRTPSVSTTQSGTVQTRLLAPQDHFWMPAEGPDAISKPITPWASSRPADNFASPDFDDSLWVPAHAPLGAGFIGGQAGSAGPGSMWDVSGAAYVSRVCARGRFQVTDPAKAGALKLAARYRGGVIVYLNGQEIGRADLPAGKLADDALAAAYPDEAYRLAPGKCLNGERTDKSTPEEAAGFNMRDRSLTIDVPASALRKGVNVLAVVAHSAPYRDICCGEPREYHGKKYRNWPPAWPHCRILNVQLTSPTGEGVVANAGRPHGVQLWQPPAWGMIGCTDYGDPCLPIQPIRLIGFRNGAFSGQLVVSSDAAIAAVSASAADLVDSRGGGRIPASAVHIRYADWDDERFDGLLEKPVLPVPLRQPRHPGVPAGQAAVQPIWVIVNVSADTRPGEYAGTVTVSAEGLPPVAVPLNVTVRDWRLPEPGDLVMHNDLWQSHESVAARYKAPLWSERHFELMGQCLALTAPLANKFCNVHLVCKGFCIGNTESMVRWVDKGDGTYDHDFSVMDKYLDLHERILGKPKALLVDVCVSIHSASRPKDGSNSVRISVENPATRKITPTTQPAYGTPEGIALWNPMMTRLRERLEKRGWWDVALIGTASDSGPTSNEVRHFKAIWPDRDWLFSGHPNQSMVGAGTDKAKVKLVEWVWGVGNLWGPPANGSSQYPRPWTRKSGQISVAYPRLGAGSLELYQRSDLRTYRLKPEMSIQSGQDGFGRVGINFWYYPDANGRKRQLDFGQGTGQFFFNNAVPAFLAAGPDGPVHTTRSQMFREGIQIREAITFLLKAEDSGKLPAELAARINRLTRQRAANMLSPDGHRGWMENDDRLYSLCADVAGTVAGEPK